MDTISALTPSEPLNHTNDGHVDTVGHVLRVAGAPAVVDGAGGGRGRVLYAAPEAQGAGELVEDGESAV